MNRTILVPVDGSDESYAGLEYALDTYSEAQIIAFHAVLPTNLEPESLDATTYDWDEYMSSQEQRATEILADAESLAENYNQSIASELWIGTPAKAIIEFASQSDIDHIIIGSRGVHKAETPALGSVAETVLHRSPVLVTIIR